MVGRIGGFVLTGIGMLIVALGLLFLVGSAGQTVRLVVGFVALGIGGTTTAVGVAIHLLADRREPGRIRDEIFALAERQNGMVSEAELLAAFANRWASGPEICEALIVEGHCVKIEEGRSWSLLFPKLQPQLVVRHCEHCNTSQSLAAAAETCPNCGGSLTTAVKRVEPADDDAYHMDE